MVNTRKKRLDSRKPWLPNRLVMFHQSGPGNHGTSPGPRQFLNSSGKTSHKNRASTRKPTPPKGLSWVSFVSGRRSNISFPHLSVVSIAALDRERSRDPEIQGVNLYLMSWCCQKPPRWVCKSNMLEPTSSKVTSHIKCPGWSYHLSFSSDFVQPETVWFLNETQGELRTSPVLLGRRRTQEGNPGIACGQA